MAGVGYNTGLLKGMTAAQEINASRSREAAMAEEIQASRLKQMMQMQQMATEQQEKKLLQDAFVGTSAERVEGEKVNLEDQLGQKYLAAGKAMLITNPKLGMQLMKEGNDMLGTSSEGQARLLRNSMVRHQIVGDLANTVYDQASLDKAIQDMANVGEEIPPQFRVWNPVTAEWFKKRGSVAESAYKNASLGLRANGQAIQQDALDHKITIDEQKKLDADRKFALRQEAMKKTGYKALDRKEIRAAANILNEDPIFSPLSEEDQALAARDIDMRAFALFKDGKAGDLATANQMAKDEVASKIKDERYLGFTSTTRQFLPEEQVKQTLGSKYKPGYRYWVEGGRIKGEPL